MKSSFHKILYVYFRRMVVLEPLKVTITNFPSKDVINIDVPNFPDDASKGTHTIQFSSTIFIERSDFREVCI